MALTENQQNALDDIASQKVFKRRYGHGAWRIDGPSHPSVVGRVISMGLARWQRWSSDAEIAVLTEAGAKALTGGDNG